MNVSSAVVTQQALLQQQLANVAVKSNIKAEQAVVDLVQQSVNSSRGQNLDILV